MKNELLVYAIEREYQNAVHWENFWVGTPTIDGVWGEPEIMEWAVEGVPEPDSLIDLTARYQEEFMAEVRLNEVMQRKNNLLSEVDAIATNPLRWGALTEEEKQALADYRQALLDVPQQEGFPDDIDWPQKPETIAAN